MTEQQLQEIEARANATTPGPWEIERNSSGWIDGIRAPNGDEIVKTDFGVYPPERPDAEFIAHARTDVPKLLAEVRMLKYYLEASQEALEQTKSDCARLMGICYGEIK